jgi:hypothetical protein
MAAKKLTETQKRLALIDSLIASGYKSEKAVTDMTIDQILGINGLSVDEMRSISELQKAIKTHRIISFIAGGDDGE